MEIRADASVTGGASRDLETREGESLALLLARLTAAPGARDAPAWCGGVPLDRSHPVGRWPLVDGAVLSAAPAPWPVAPVGPHLAIACGPDAGWLLPLASTVRIGSGPFASQPRTASGAALLDHALVDPALDPHHVTLDGAVRGAAWRDLGTVNGTGTRAATLNGRRSARGTIRVRAADVTRRRRGVLGPGQSLVAGRTAVEWRCGQEGQCPRVPGDATARGAASDGAQRACACASSPRHTGEWDLEATPFPSALPDPTSPGRAVAAWNQPVHVFGPAAVGFARALILARGSLPADVAGDGAGELLAEPWVRGRPPAPASHGAIVVGVGHPRGEGAPQGSATARRSGELVVMSDATHTSVDRTALAPLGVGIGAAELAARALASRGGASVGRTLRWRTLPPQSAGTIAWGRASDGTVVTWNADAAGAVALVAGAHGSGVSTSLWTAVTALAAGAEPEGLDVVLIAPRGEEGRHVGRGAPGRLRITVPADEAEALAMLRDPAPASGSRQLVAIDGADRLPSGALVAAALNRPPAASEAIIIGTSRVAGVVTPGLLARATIIVAHRMANASDAADVVGVADASALPIRAPGLAYVRWAGRTSLARIAICDDDGACSARSPG